MYPRIADSFAFGSFIRSVSASNHLNIWPIKQHVTSDLRSTSHNGIVSAILYNEKFHEVITADDESTGDC